MFPKLRKYPVPYAPHSNWKGLILSMALSAPVPDCEPLSVSLFTVRCQNQLLPSPWHRSWDLSLLCPLLCLLSHPLSSGGRGDDFHKAFSAAARCVVPPAVID